MESLEPRQLLAADVDVWFSSTSDASEGGANGYVVVSRDTTDGDLDVHYSVSGTATNATDYASLSGTIQIPDGSSSASIDITPVDDTNPEGDETVELTLQTDAAYEIASSSFASITITDNDNPIVSIVADSSAHAAEPTNGTSENEVTQSVTISRTGPTDQQLVVYYDTAAAAQGVAGEGSDYDLVDGSNTLASSVTIPVGQSQVTIDVTPLHDTLVEGDESATINLATHSTYEIESASSEASVTIDDNDVPTVSITASGNATEPVDAADESNTANYGQFVLTLDQAAVETFTVYYNAIAHPTHATEGTDYETLSSTVTFNVGDTVKTIDIKPKHDTLAEDDEIVQLQLSAGADYTLSSSSQASITITDNDNPIVSIVADSSAHAAEPTNGTSENEVTQSVTISRTGPTDQQLVVYYDTAAAAQGVAGEGSDYDLVDGSNTLASSVTIPVGQSQVTIDVTPLHDTLVEGDESATINLATHSTYEIESASSEASVTIDDNDVPTVSITASGNATEPVDAADESNTANYGQFVLTLDQAAVETFTVYYNAIAHPTHATEGTDYETLSSTVTFNVGDTVKTIDIKPKHDTLAEDDEIVQLQLSAGADYTLSSSSQASITITDNDNPIVSIVADSSAHAAEPTNGTSENEVTQSVTISRTGPTDQQLVVYYDTAAAAQGVAGEGSDYDLVDGSNTLASSVTIPVGQSQVTIDVTPLHDTLVEGDESATINLATHSTYEIESASSEASVTIDDNDVPTVSITASGNATEPVDAADESNTANYGQFVLTLDQAAVETFTVYYNAIAHPTHATEGTDYETLSSTVTFNVGDTVKTIDIKPKHDTLAEDDEIVQLQLSAGADYTLSSSSQASITITDNDNPIVSIVADSSAHAAEPTNGTSENEVTQSVTISRTGPTDQQLVVYYDTAAAAQGVAGEGSDYDLVDGSNTLASSVTIPVGQSQVTIDVTPLHDTLVEGDESATINLATHSTYEIESASSEASVTIDDNDVPTVSITASGNATEPVDAADESNTANYGHFLVSLDQPAVESFDVYYYALTGGTHATEGTDYQWLSSTVTFAVGEQHKTIEIRPEHDSLPEVDETVELQLSAGTGYTVGASSEAAITIIDNDLPL